MVNLLLYIKSGLLSSEAIFCYSLEIGGGKIIFKKIIVESHFYNKTKRQLSV